MAESIIIGYRLGLVGRVLGRVLINGYPVLFKQTGKGIDRRGLMSERKYSLAWHCLCQRGSIPCLGIAKNLVGPHKGHHEGCSAPGYFDDVIMILSS